MSALDVIKSLTVSSPFFADVEISRKRSEFCRTCPHSRNGLCLECGCVIMIKTKLSAEACPLKKWGKV